MQWKNVATATRLGRCWCTDSDAEYKRVITLLMHSQSIGSTVCLMMRAKYVAEGYSSRSHSALIICLADA